MLFFMVVDKPQRWTYLLFVFELLTLSTITFSLVTTRSLVRAQRNAAATATAWTRHVATAAELGGLAAHAVPSVDVLQASDLGDARSEGLHALEQLNDKLAVLRDEIAAMFPAGLDEPLTATFDAAEAGIHNMGPPGDSLFATLARGQTRAALARLTELGGYHARIAIALGRLRGEMQRRLEAELQTQAAAAARLQTFEYIVGAGVLLFASAVGWHGRRLQRRMRERDAEESARTQAALRSSEEKFSKAFRASPNPMLITRLRDGLVIEANDAFLATSGYHVDDLVGKPTTAVLWPRPDRRQQLMAALQRDGHVRNFELELQTKTGGVIDILAFMEVMDLEGEAHIVSAAIDVTERQKAAAALRESEERFRLAMLATNDAVYDWDMVSDTIWWSDAVGRLFGYSMDVVRPEIRWWSEHVHPDDLQAVMAGLEAATARHGSVWTSEYRFRRADGSWAQALDRGHFLYDDDGRAVRMIGAMADVTARADAERQQARLRDALMASAVDWTVTFDAIESPMLIVGDELRVRRVNRAARELASRNSYTALIGAPLNTLGTDEPWLTMARLTTHVLRAGAPASAPVSPEGRGRSWLVAANPVDLPGEERRAILLARDVSDVVGLERSLRRTETMSALGSLVAGVAHEVRNPLFAISATVDAFEARFGVQEQTGRYTETLRREVRRLSELMRELLEYGRPPQLELGDASVETLVRRALEHATTLPRAEGVTVIETLEPGLPAVRMDPSRMLQVLTNLVENALQHSPKQGVVELGAQTVSDDGGDWLELTVADRGPGFRPDDLPLIFEPFFTRRRGGTGLGLSIVQRIVEQHGGTVSARNRPEGGALMIVRLRPAGVSSTSTPSGNDRVARAHTDR